jgi:hypothetical protein
MIQISKLLIGLMNIIIENDDLHDIWHITDPRCKNIGTRSRLDYFPLSKKNLINFVTKYTISPRLTMKYRLNIDY